MGLHGALAGKRILVVEDEYFIATELKDMLAAREADVIGPTGDLDQGIALAEGSAIDAAVIDVNLSGALSYPLADCLADRGIPFVFVTGYDGWAMPEAYRHVPRVGKPFAIGTLLDAIDALMIKEPAS